MIRIKEEYRDRLIELNAYKAWCKEMFDLLQNYPLADVIEKIEYANKATNFWSFIDRSFHWDQALKGSEYWEAVSKGFKTPAPQKATQLFNISKEYDVRKWKDVPEYEKGLWWEEAVASLDELEELLTPNYRLITRTKSELVLEDNDEQIITYKIVEQ